MMNQPNENIDHIPDSHPRGKSLRERHKIIEGMKNLIVAEAGLIAHGRGEAFDYILGEKTNPPALKAIYAGVAMLLLAKHPIISVNGNTAALAPKELVKLSKILNCKLEINLFYRKEGRIEAIKNVLEKAGAKEILGTNNDELVEIEEILSNRRKVDPKGIKMADTVFVPLEDGDRTEALKKIGKKVIAVDLNPLSRTSINADITIVDNIIRVLPKMIEITKELKDYTTEDLYNIIIKFNNKKNIQDMLKLIKKYIETQKEDTFKILEP